MTEYLLDTDTCIFHLKNKFNIRSKILSVGRTDCYICELTVAELLYGAYNLLIGVTALYHNMTLVTNNTKHMSRIEGLKLENWTQAAFNEFA